MPVQSKVYGQIPNHTLCIPCRKLCKPVDEGDDDVLDVDGGLELCAGLKEVGEGAEMELVGEHLDDALHQILLEKRGMVERMTLTHHHQQHKSK